MTNCICNHNEESHSGFFNKRKSCKRCDCVSFTPMHLFVKKKHKQKQTELEVIKESEERTGSGITFGNAPSLVMMLVLIGMVVGSGTIALSAFSDLVIETGSISNTTISSSFSDQLPTVGTILGVGLILAVVISVFSFSVRL